MNFGWGAAAPLSPGEGAGTELNLLGDNLLIDLDDKTLQESRGRVLGGLPAACMRLGDDRRRRQLPGLSPAALLAQWPALRAAHQPCRPTCLQCLMGGPSTGFAACISGQPGEATSSGSKRPRGEGEGEIMAAVPGDEGDEGEDSEEGRCGRGGRGGKKAPAPGSDAATVKAHREKARRERLNEW